MRSADMAVRLSVVFAVAGSIALAAGIYEIDRREKSTSETVTANLTEVEQRVQSLGDQIRVLNEQSSKQQSANERQIRALLGQIEALESRLKEIEDDFRARRPESAPPRR
jgi:peptidoglycan hydrolase CwlO-like protein